MTKIIDPLNDDLFRGYDKQPETRADGGTDGALMYGHFSVFNTFYEINSYFEGRFLEQVAPGSFKKTMRERRDQIKVQFDHGYDMNIGDALLGPIDDLREDDSGAYFEVPLLDTDYNRDRILPMLQGRLMNGQQRGSLLGSSFRFNVIRDEWNMEPKASDTNPDALPERTIREVRLFEFGPVVYPASPTATSAARSLTDEFYARRLARMGTAERAAQHLASFSAGTPATGMDAPSNKDDTPAERHLSMPTGRLVASAITDIERFRREVSGNPASEAR